MSAPRKSSDMQRLIQSNLAVAEALNLQTKAMQDLTEGIASLLDQMADDAQEVAQPRMLDGSLL
ncbi:Motility protein [Comamonas aquatilis]